MNTNDYSSLNHKKSSADSGQYGNGSAYRPIPAAAGNAYGSNAYPQRSASHDTCPVPRRVFLEVFLETAISVREDSRVFRRDSLLGNRHGPRITSYNVCYTKLLRFTPKKESSCRFNVPPL